MGFPRSESPLDNLSFAFPDYLIVTFQGLAQEFSDCCSTVMWKVNVDHHPECDTKNDW